MTGFKNDDINEFMNKINLKIQVYKSIKTSILNFQLLPGVKLSEKSIAQDMGISRTPVKAALIRLSEQGLIKAHHNRGFTVKSFKAEEIYNLYTVREALEILAIQQATPNLDKKKEKKLREPVDRCLSLMKSNNLIGMIDCDEKFHKLIALYSENNTLINFLNSINYQIRIARRYDHLHGDSTKIDYEEHSKIIDFMVQKEVSKASKTISRHVTRARGIILNILKVRQAHLFGQ